MKDKPQMKLIGMDGNIYFVMGSAARALKRDGLYNESKEMFDRVTCCHSYEDALCIISEYVQTELSDNDCGILEADDIHVDSEMIPDKNGVTAYIETWFDTERRFNVPLGPEESIDFYATVQPETDTLKASIIIKREPSGEHECREIHLLPSEQQLIKSKMEQAAKENGDVSLANMYSEWKSENNKTKHKEKKNTHER